MNYSCVQFQINVNAKRNKRGWHNYATAYSVNNIKGKFNNIPKAVYENGTLKEVANIEFSHPAEDESGEGKNHIFVYNLGVVVKNYTEAIQNATCIHYAIWTRGTYPEVLGYNYYNGNYSDDHNKKNDPLFRKICPYHDNVLNGY